MPFFLYEAVDAAGNPVADAVDAATAQDAHARLVMSGHRDIRLLTDQTTAAMHNDLGAMSPEDRQRMAAARVRQMHARGQWQSHWAALMDMVRPARYALSAALVLAIYQAWHGHWLSAIPLALYVCHPLLRLLWSLISVDRYRQLQTAMVHGRWAESLQLIERLRRQGRSRALIMDLDFREAQVRIRRGDAVDPHLQYLMRWQSELPRERGLFESRLAGLYLAIGDYDRYREAARTSLEAAPKDASRLIELAMAEARFGSLSEARKLLERVDAKVLTGLAGTYRQWVEAVIALNSGEAAKAEVLLALCAAQVADLVRRLPMAEAWQAMLAGQRSLALARLGRREEASRLPAAVWSLLQLHADPAFLAMLRQEAGVPA
ncbi:MAG TPA: hypothetical protein VFW42_07595 [Fluviicoccus sp.]|nr:hypothetical protein [Fluviicoccus sp.]